MEEEEEEGEGEGEQGENDERDISKGKNQSSIVSSIQDRKEKPFSSSSAPRLASPPSSRSKSSDPIQSLEAELKRLRLDLDMERGQVNILRHENQLLRQQTVDLVGSRNRSLSPTSPLLIQSSFHSHTIPLFR